MKKLIIIVLVAAMGAISFHTEAQNSKNVPQALAAAFTAKYPEAQLKRWKNDHNIYSAVFLMNNKKYQASFADNGTWIKTARNIRHISNLPAEVRSFLKTNGYASWHIDNMTRLRTPVQNTYQVEVDNASGNVKWIYEDAGSLEDKMLSFNDQGKLLKTTDLY